MDNPTYYNLDGYSETVQIEFDPTIISFEKLLDVFWASHDPRTDTITQYKSIIFYHSEEQRKTALESRQRQETSLGARLYTDILPFDKFYLAEDYHQKYDLSGLWITFKELSSLYPEQNEFLNSTAVARLNGYAGGYGDSEKLIQLMDEIGLSAESRKELTQRVALGLAPGCPVN